MADRHANESPMVESDITVIRAELERLLNERRFSGAPQMSAFLRYIVNETLDGNADRIKAFSVGVDALGKPDTFDAQTDPSVRVLALRLRKTLNTIYQDKSSSLAIVSLKVGTYVPTFLKVSDSYPCELTNSDHSGMSASVASLGYQSVAENGSDTIGQQKAPSVDVGVFAEKTPADQSPVSGSINGSIATSSSNNSAPSSNLQRSSVATVVDTRTYSRWLLLLGAVLLVAAWQFGVKNVGAQASTSSDAVMLAGVNPENSTPLMPAASPGLPELPTIVVRSVNDAIDVERRVVLILTSKFVQSGIVQVIKERDTSATRDYAPGEYQLYINSYIVAGEVRLNTQLVSLQQGEMLFATTIVLSQVSNRFSTEDLSTVESLALRLTSAQGPLFEHYCARHNGVDVNRCKITQDT